MTTRRKTQVKKPVAKEPKEMFSLTPPTDLEILKVDMAELKKEVAELKANLATIKGPGDVSAEARGVLDKKQPYSTHRGVGGVASFEQNGKTFNGAGKLIEEN